MNGEQMVQVTRFASALARMVQASKAAESLELSAEECGAVAAIIQSLSAGIPKSAASPPDAPSDLGATS